MHKITNYFILNLALADVLTSVFWSPIELELNMVKSTLWARLSCKIGMFSRAVNITASILTLVALSIDRCYIIIYPFNKKLTKGKSFLIIAFIWIISILIGVFSFNSNELYITELSRDLNVYSLKYTCSFTDYCPVLVYLITLLMFQYILPLFVFMFTFAYMKLHLRKAINEINLDDRTSFIRSIRTRKKVGIFQMFLFFQTKKNVFIYLGCQHDFKSLCLLFDLLDANSIV